MSTTEPNENMSPADEAMVDDLADKMADAVLKQTRESRKAKLLEIRTGRRRVNYSHLLIVGCGGTYWYAQNYLLSRFRTIPNVCCVDPDKVEEKNLGRQWLWANLNEWKSLLAMVEWQARGQGAAANANDCWGKVQEYEECLTKWLEGATGLLVVCLPDNDPARVTVLDMAQEWAKTVPDVAVVTAGNEMGLGQAWYGLARDGDWIHSWGWAHKLDGPEAEERAGCGQVASSNLLTAACVAQAIDELLDAKDDVIHEFAWLRKADGSVRMYREEVL